MERKIYGGKWGGKRSEREVVREGLNMYQVTIWKVKVKDQWAGSTSYFTSFYN